MRNARRVAMVSTAALAALSLVVSTAQASSPPRRSGWAPW